MRILGRRNALAFTHVSCGSVCALAVSQTLTSPSGGRNNVVIHAFSAEGGGPRLQCHPFLCAGQVFQVSRVFNNHPSRLSGP